MTKSLVGLEQFKTCKQKQTKTLLTYYYKT